MKRLRDILIVALVASCIGLVLVLATVVAGWGRDLHQGLADADRAILKVSTAADSLQGVISDERKAQTAQTREFQKTIADAHDLLIHTDLSLNGKTGLLPFASKTVALTGLGVNDLTQRAGDSLDRLTAAANATLDAGTRTLETVQARANDPHIDSILGNLELTSLHLEGVSANGEAISRDLGIYVHRITQPQSKWHQALSLAPAAIKIGAGFIP